MGVRKFYNKVSVQIMSCTPSLLPNFELSILKEIPRNIGFSPLNSTGVKFISDSFFILKRSAEGRDFEIQGNRRRR